MCGEISSGSAQLEMPVEDVEEAEFVRAWSSAGGRIWESSA